MLKSMTGFGRGKAELEGRNYIVEKKLKLLGSFLEDKVRKCVSNVISRGKIDILVTFVNESDKGRNIKINKGLAKIYLDEIRSLAAETNLDSNVSVMELTKLPDVLTIENETEDEILWKELSIALDEAIKNFIDMRKEEGNNIACDLRKRIELVNEKVQLISEKSSGLVQEYISKLEERIKELLKTDVVDQTRLAQEVVIYSDKCSIQEELTRLKSHTKQFLDTIEKDEPVGKNLDFLVQEMNRETNTIGSKANNLDITKLVIEIKTIIEDIREQIQNIE